MTAQEKNEHYGKLNRRFDERASMLRSLGFKYIRAEIESVKDGSAFFVFGSNRLNSYAISASVVLMADAIVWEDKVDEIKRRVSC